MISNIQKKFERLTSKRDALLQNLEALSFDELNYRVGPDKWTVVEVVEHLFIAEKDLLKQLSIQRPSFDGESKSPEKYKTVIKVMERDIPVDVPDEILEPHGRLTLREIVSRWHSIREKLRELLAGINSANKDDPVYRHAFAGPLDIFETLHFMDVHFDNHLRQIDRIITEMT
jgi:DinB superfamily